MFAVYLLKVTFLGSFFFTCSIALTFYNKWLFQSFNFPLLVTLIHFLTQFVLAGLIRSVMSCSRSSPILLSWSAYCKRIYPAGVTAALDIGLSNMSMMFITVSLYVMSKTTSVVFVLMFAILLRLESPRISTLLVVVLVSVGLFLFTYKSTQFNLGGFILVMTASFLSGLRWVLLQSITQKEELGLSNPIDTTYHMAPIMALGLVGPAFFMEGFPASLSDELFRFESYMTLESTTGKIALGAGIAFLLTISEYMFVHQTSSLTLSISGIFKELLTMFLAAEINHDHMSLINMAGAALCLTGIMFHVIFKAVYTKNRYDVHGSGYGHKKRSSRGSTILMSDRSSRNKMNKMQLLGGDDDSENGVLLDDTFLIISSDEEEIGMMQKRANVN